MQWILRQIRDLYVNYMLACTTIDQTQRSDAKYVSTVSVCTTSVLNSFAYIAIIDTLGITRDAPCQESILGSEQQLESIIIGYNRVLVSRLLFTVYIPPCM